MLISKKSQNQNGKTFPRVKVSIKIKSLNAGKPSSKKKSNIRNVNRDKSSEKIESQKSFSKEKSLSSNNRKLADKIDPTKEKIKEMERKHANKKIQVGSHSSKELRSNKENDDTKSQSSNKDNEDSVPVCINKGGEGCVISLYKNF